VEEEVAVIMSEEEVAVVLSKPPLTNQFLAILQLSLELVVPEVLLTMELKEATLNSLTSYQKEEVTELNMLLEELLVDQEDQVEVAEMVQLEPQPTVSMDLLEELEILLAMLVEEVVEQEALGAQLQAHLRL
jgi:hypothetical protein